MARGSSLLSSPVPCTAVPARVTIGHVQLRDVLICPHERGIVSYARECSIVEHDLLASNAAPRRLVDLPFVPNSLSALVLPNSSDTLLAVGGQEAELHLSYYKGTAPSSDAAPLRPVASFGTREWESKDIVEQGSINNSVLLTSLSLTRSNESNVEPRLIVSNNDRSVKFYDVALRENSMAGASTSRLVNVGQLRLHVPINHSSISPDGRTLLSVGDSPDVYLHRISGGSKVQFTPTALLSLSPHIGNAFMPAQSSTVPASFSSAFSGDGSKFAVASQEGVVVVWDVRSTKPLKVFHTDKSRESTSRSPINFYQDVPWDWTRGSASAPGWGVRSVKFSPRGVGKEVMTFTEHTSLLHVIDARTFETEEIVRMPNCDPPLSLPRPTRPRSTSPTRSLITENLPPPPPPPRIFLFSGALEDTFRIPSSDRIRGSRSVQTRGTASPDDDLDGIVVIPPLGDREVEADVRRLLGRHGLRTRSTILDPEPEQDSQDRDEASRTQRDDDDEAMRDAPDEDEMDVDELEWDCLSYTPSRAPSPGPGPLPVPAPRSPEIVRSQRPGLLARRESTGPYVARRPSLNIHRRMRRAQREAPDVDQDIAGTCFDPSGSFIYVASTKGVVEWRVRGVEQQWWTNCSWK